MKRTIPIIKKVIKELLHLGGIGDAVFGEGFLGALVRLPVEEGVAGTIDNDELGLLADVLEVLHIFFHRLAADGAVLGTEDEELRGLAGFREGDVAVRGDGDKAHGSEAFAEAGEGLQVEDTVARGGRLDGLEAPADLLHGPSGRDVGGTVFVHVRRLSEAAVADALDQVDHAGGKMSARAVASHGKFLGIHTILGRMLLDVENRAVAVLDELVHRVGFGVTVGGVQPAVVDAGNYIFAALDEFAGQAAHDILRIGRPTAAVDDDDAGEFLRAVRDEDIVLEGLDARLRVHDVIDGPVALDLTVNSGVIDSL